MPWHPESDGVDVPKLSADCLNTFTFRDYDQCVVWGASLLPYTVHPIIAHALLISLQRLSRNTELEAISATFLRRTADTPWENSLLRVTLGELDSTELTSQATDDVKRCQLYCYAANRFLTMERRARAFAKMREAMALPVDQEKCMEAGLVWRQLVCLGASNCPDTALAALRKRVEECLYTRRYTKALAPAQRVVKLVRETLGTSHTTWILALTDLAIIHDGLGNSAEATRFLTEAVDSARSALGAGYDTFLRGLNNQAEEHRWASRYATGSAFRQRCDALLEKTFRKAEVGAFAPHGRPAPRASPGGDAKPRPLALDRLLRISSVKALEPITESWRVRATLLKMMETWVARQPRWSRQFSRLAKYLREIDARYAEPHRRALDVIRARIEHGTPFGLFLRNFGWFSNHASAGPGPMAKEFEERFAQVVQDRLPMIGVADHDVGLEMTFLPPGQSVARLVVPKDGWDEVSEELIDLAAIIVLYCGEMTASLVEEIEMIRQRGKAKETLIVIGKSRPVEDPNGKTIFIGETLKPHVLDGKPAAIDDKRLAEFPLKIHEEGISSAAGIAELEALLRQIWPQ